MSARLDTLKRDRELAAAELVGWAQAIIADEHCCSIPAPVLDIGLRIVGEYNAAHAEVTAQIEADLAAAFAEPS